MFFDRLVRTYPINVYNATIQNNILTYVNASIAENSGNTISYNYTGH